MSTRQRNGLILLLILGFLAGSGIVIASQPTKLGLDLQGGVELVYQAQPTPQSKVDSNSINRAIEIMRDRVDALGVSEPEIQRSGADQITVGLPAVSNAQRAEKQVGTPAQLTFYDWEANVLMPNGQPASSGIAAKDPAAVKLMSFSGDPAGGSSLIKAVTLGTKQAVRGGANISRIGPQYWLFNATGKKLVAGPDSSTKDLYSEFPGKVPPAGSQLLTIPQGTVVLRAVYKNNTAPKDLAAAKWYTLRDDVALFGKDIRNPKQGLDTNQAGSPDVEFSFTDRGKTAFHDVTRTIAQRGQEVSALYQPTRPTQHFAVSLDQDLISVATIDYGNLPDGIDGLNGAIITGGFTIQTAQDLAKLLELGALPIGLKLISQSQVSATLGKQALDQGLVAGLVGFAVVMFFLLAFYRVLGLVACGALLIYAAFLLAIVKAIPITMTLPGIAGLILTIGVAADANIVIFERVKEEIRSGRTVAAGITQGYKKGLSAIIDANVVTLMTAFILFMLATAGVKGFAFTLGVGTIVSLLTAVVATQAALGFMSSSRMISSPAALGASGKEREWRFDFMGASRWFFSLSGLILMIGALAIGGKGLNFGIDFTSGTRMVTSLVKPATENQVRAVLETKGITDAKIQRVNNKELGPNGIQISTAELEPAQVGVIQNKLDAKFGGTRNFSSQSVGPTFGRTVADSAVIAIIASLFVISAYIALRFEWKFAVPVLIALMHDLLITAGVYALLGREVTTATVAALLTILGYSLYDTIIVFDRIRENTPRMPRAAFSQIVNRSMSEVLTRSLATSFCTLLPILALLLFGGATLQDFAFALLVGVASGTYSSIFIASPLLTYSKEREPTYARRALRLAAASPGGKIPAYYSGATEGLSRAELEKAERPKQQAAIDPATGVAPISPAEFERMAAEVQEELAEAKSEAAAEDVPFEHAPDSAEADQPAPPSGRPSNRKKKRRSR
ncbi:MAG: protein translocase subunit SecD [Solirubrobacterales bacterium]|nr:protein translocase subunit SecD [Solirubrobacterales bacterium]